MRERNGLVRQQAAARLTLSEREYLATSGFYGRDELHTQEGHAPSQVVDGLLGMARNSPVDRINGGMLARTSGTEWRQLVEGAAGTAGSGRRGVCDLLSALPPHLSDALECQPEAFQDAAERAVWELTTGDEGCLLGKNSRRQAPTWSE